MTAPKDIAFVPIASSCEMGGDEMVSTHVAWLPDGFAVLHVSSFFSEQEPILSAELRIVDHAGERRKLPSIRFEDQGRPTEHGEERVISLDELYATSEHGDREKTLMDVAAVLVQGHAGA